MKIQPCPFCGTEAECIEAMNESWCRCLNKHCMANGPARAFKRNAILKWNERVTFAPHQASNSIVGQRDAALTLLGGVNDGGAKC